MLCIIITGHIISRAYTVQRAATQAGLNSLAMLCELLGACLQWDFVENWHRNLSVRLSCKASIVHTCVSIIGRCVVTIPPKPAILEDSNKGVACELSGTAAIFKLSLLIWLVEQCEKNLHSNVQNNHFWMKVSWHITVSYGTWVSWS